VREWLDRAPTSNPVDRLNARFTQLLMIGIGLASILNRLYFTWAEPNVALPATWSLDQLADLFGDIAISAAAWIGVVVIRRGHFNRGFQLFLGVFLLSFAANLATTGYRHTPPDPTPTLLLAIGGVVLGRRTLWAIYTAVMAIFALGQLADALWLAEPRPTLGYAFHALPMLVVAYLLVAFAIDNTTRALRTMLAEAQQRSDALALANEQLKKEMEERLQAQRQLIHSQKLDAVGRAATGVAHDFGNVLNVILGYASQREQLADLGTPALLDAMEGVEIAALRALTLSRKLLNFSRQDVSVTQVFDATVALQELAPMLRQLLGGYIQLDLHLGIEPLPLLLDRGQFELMVLNIAANARDAMPEGGRFGLFLEESPEKTSLLLTLSDTGVGMTGDVQAKVFEPFYTTKPFGRGTGLGLSVVASMIEAASGRIEVSSAPSQGTRFRIQLPLHRDDNTSCDVDEQYSGVAGEQVALTARSE
jgi:signal transduction histidine kinase